MTFSTPLQSYNNNSSTTTFGITFPYLLPDHLVVKIDDTVIPSSKWSVEGSMLSFSNRPDGDTLTIERETPINTLFSHFEAENLLTAEDLNETNYYNFTYFQEMKLLLYYHSSRNVQRLTETNEESYAFIKNKPNIFDPASTDPVTIRSESIILDGDLLLKGDPTIPFQAATKSYVDTIVQNVADIPIDYPTIQSFIVRTEQGQTTSNGRRIINLFEQSYDLRFPTPPRSSVQNVFSGRGEDVYWTAIKEVPSTPGTQSGIGHVLTVTGENDDDFAWRSPTGGGGGGAAITIQDEGSDLQTAAETINFIGDGVTAAGSGTVKTIDIPGVPLTKESLYPGISDTLNAGEHITLQRDPATNRITINAEGPGEAESLTHVVLTARTGIPGESATNRSYPITASQTNFLIEVETSGTAGGRYPRLWVRRNELSGTAERFVWDTHNPTEAAANRTVGLDIALSGSVLFVKVPDNSPDEVAIREVAALVGGGRGPQGIQGVQGIQGEAGRDANIGSPQGLKIAETTFSIDESADITAQDWTLTSDSSGNLISGTRISLRTNRPTSGTRNHEARLGYLFQLTRAAGLNSTTDSEAIYLYGDEERLVMGLNAQISSTLVHGKIDLGLSYGRTGNFVDVTIGGGEVDAAWSSTTASQNYTISVYELIIQGQPGPRGEPGADGEPGRDGSASFGSLPGTAISTTASNGSSANAAREDHVHNLGLIATDFEFFADKLGLSTSFKTGLSKFAAAKPIITPNYWLVPTTTAISYEISVDGFLLSSTVRKLNIRFGAVTKQIAVTNTNIHDYTVSFNATEASSINVATGTGETLPITIDYLDADDVLEATQRTIIQTIVTPPTQILALSQAQYDSLAVKNAETVYLTT